MGFQVLCPMMLAELEVVETDESDQSMARRNFQSCTLQEVEPGK